MKFAARISQGPFLPRLKKAPFYESYIPRTNEASYTNFLGGSFFSRVKDAYKDAYEDAYRYLTPFMKDLYAQQQLALDTKKVINYWATRKPVVSTKKAAQLNKKKKLVIDDKETIKKKQETENQETKKVGTENQDATKKQNVCEKDAAHHVEKDAAHHIAPDLQIKQAVALCAVDCDVIQHADGSIGFTSHCLDGCAETQYVNYL